MSVAAVAAFCQSPGIGIQMFGTGWRKPSIWSIIIIIISSSSSSSGGIYNTIQITFFSIKHDTIKQWQHTWRHLFRLPKSKTAKVKISCEYKYT